MMNFNIRKNDSSETMTDGEIAFLDQQLRIIAAVIKDGPPVGSQNWTEEQWHQHFQTRLASYTMTPPTVGKCAWSVFAVVQLLAGCSRDLDPLAGFQQESLFLGAAYGAQYLSALAVELALKHAISQSPNPKYPHTHKLDQLWQALVAAHPEIADQIRSHFLDNRSASHPTNPSQTGHSVIDLTIDQVMKDWNNHWELRYWFEPRPHVKEDVHHGNNLMPLVIAFLAIMYCCPEQDSG